MANQPGGDVGGPWDIHVSNAETGLPIANATLDTLVAGGGAVLAQDVGTSDVLGVISHGRVAGQVNFQLRHGGVAYKFSYNNAPDIYIALNTTTGKLLYPITIRVLRASDDAPVVGAAVWGRYVVNEDALGTAVAGKPFGDGEPWYSIGGSKLGNTAFSGGDGTIPIYADHPGLVQLFIHGAGNNLSPSTKLMTFGTTGGTVTVKLFNVPAIHDTGECAVLVTLTRTQANQNLRFVNNENVIAWLTDDADEARTVLAGPILVQAVAPFDMAGALYAKKSTAYRLRIASPRYGIKSGGVPKPNGVTVTTGTSDRKSVVIEVDGVVASANVGNKSVVVSVYGHESGSSQFISHFSSTSRWILAWLTTDEEGTARIGSPTLINSSRVTPPTLTVGNVPPNQYWLWVMADNCIPYIPSATTDLTNNAAADVTLHHWTEYLSHYIDPAQIGIEAINIEANPLNEEGVRYNGTIVCFFETSLSFHTLQGPILVAGPFDNSSNRRFAGIKDFGLGVYRVNIVGPTRLSNNPVIQGPLP